MPEPRVLILIVAYNSERFIARTIQSCLGQTYKNCQVVILDNASTDRTVAVIEGLQASRVQLFRSDANLGPYAGLNYLLDRVEAPYIAIQDHDDLWLPTKIKEQVDCLEHHREYIACGTQAFYYHEREQVLISTDNFAINGYPDHTTLMFRPGVFRYDVARALPDEYFQAVILRRGGKIGHVPKPLSVHRIRNDSNNLSSARNRWNFRGAFEHLTNTRYRDVLGSLSMILAAVLPRRVLWWSRRRISYRRADWIPKETFEAAYHFPLD